MVTSVLKNFWLEWRPLSIQEKAVCSRNTGCLRRGPLLRQGIPLSFCGSGGRWLLF